MDRRTSLFLVCLVVAVGACATVDPWQDARIESEVKARLVAEKDATARDVLRLIDMVRAQVEKNTGQTLPLGLMVW